MRTALTSCANCGCAPSAISSVTRFETESFSPDDTARDHVARIGVDRYARRSQVPAAFRPPVNAYRAETDGRQLRRYRLSAREYGGDAFPKTWDDRPRANDAMREFFDSA